MSNSLQFSYGNQNISYAKVGTGVPLVILHGWGSSKRVMLPIAKQLSHLRTSYIIDLPGFGDSAEPSRGWNIVNLVNNKLIKY